MIEMPSHVAISPDALAGYADLSPALATVLVRAARLYQAGLWLADISPNDAWLMFVSAVEVAAVTWRSERVGDPEALLRQLRASWVKRLERTGDSTVVKDMAERLVRLLGVTDRFIDFVLAHFPDPPEVRPPIYQIDWTQEGLRAILNKVYEHRSNALHEGIPFPVPMCRRPWTQKDWAAPAESPVGISTAAIGGVWLREEYPVHLHIFAHIARMSLLKWWRGLRPAALPGTDGGQGVV